jgi:hypothetical protein
MSKQQHEQPDPVDLSKAQIAGISSLPDLREVAFSQVDEIV